MQGRHKVYTDIDYETSTDEDDFLDSIFESQAEFMDGVTVFVTLIMVTWLIMYIKAYLKVKEDDKRRMASEAFYTKAAAANALLLTLFTYASFFDANLGRVMPSDVNAELPVESTHFAAALNTYAGHAAVSVLAVLFLVLLTCFCPYIMFEEEQRISAESERSFVLTPSRGGTLMSTERLSPTLLPTPTRRSMITEEREREEQDSLLRESLYRYRTAPRTSLAPLASYRVFDSDPKNNLKAELGSFGEQSEASADAAEEHLLGSLSDSSMGEAKRESFPQEPSNNEELPPLKKSPQSQSDKRLEYSVPNEQSDQSESSEDFEQLVMNKDLEPTERAQQPVLSTQHSASKTASEKVKEPLRNSILSPPEGIDAFNQQEDSLTNSSESSDEANFILLAPPPSTKFHVFGQEPKTVVGSSQLAKIPEESKYLLTYKPETSPEYLLKNQNTHLSSLKNSQANANDEGENTASSSSSPICADDSSQLHSECPSC